MNAWFKGIRTLVAPILPTLLLAALACGPLTSGCGDEGEDTQADAGGEGEGEGEGEACDGHGSAHGEHCHCDTGYAPFHDTCRAVAELPTCDADEHAEGEHEEDEHEGHEEHAHSCLCAQPTQECACPDHTEPSEHLGTWYCQQELHHDE